MNYSRPDSGSTIFNPFPSVDLSGVAGCLLGGWHLSRDPWKDGPAWRGNRPLCGRERWRVLFREGALHLSLPFCFRIRVVPRAHLLTVGWTILKISSWIFNCEWASSFSVIPAFLCYALSCFSRYLTSRMKKWPLASFSLSIASILIRETVPCESGIFVPTSNKMLCLSALLQHAGELSCCGLGSPCEHLPGRKHALCVSLLRSCSNETWCIFDLGLRQVFSFTASLIWALKQNSFVQ